MRNVLEFKQKGYQKLIQGNEQQRRELRNAIHQCFVQTPEGRKVLEIFAKWADKPIAVPGIDPSHAYFRQGEVNFYQSILQAIEEVNNESS